MSGNSNPAPPSSSNSGIPPPPSPSNSGSGYGNPAPSYPGYSGSGMSSMLPMETGSPAYGAPPSQYTPPPSQSSYPSQQMPYSSFTNGGYSQMDCGYGYQKGSDGMCSPESWWGNSNIAPPYTMTVTEKSIETMTSTVTCTETLSTTMFSTLTMTDLKTDTLFVTKTETLPVTLTSTSIMVDPTTVTMTDTVMNVLTDFITKTDVSILPTTVTSIWVSTDIIDMVSAPSTSLNRADGMLPDQHCRTHSHIDRPGRENDDQHTHLHPTSTKTDVSTQLSVSTSTTTQVLQQSGLSDCLSSCNQYKYLTTGNSNMWNTYASPPAYTPSPTSQPYQYMSQGGGYSQGSGDTTRDRQLSVLVFL
ncbi:hypothetical protein BJ322DRAFT_1113712 [Thelephora terrestris]|uniref:Uncharacterized protein n=1 Tax=Thelephora terrestris TaxID=56493 RepID=A0A9P6L2I3_9AGAM|nr:hypothetical protein BJ322DRAFT_1113910 [Thelephora terrestris]KAF9779355.1 hypothetical protein BJ322DRAFT_1113712 [Thelephora terrestris]